jgi:hypothetical protein
VFQLRCFLGFHRRSGRHVVERDKRLWTVCSRCGTGMVRDDRRKWVTGEADARGGGRLAAALPWIVLALTLAAAMVAILLAIRAIR